MKNIYAERIVLRTKAPTAIQTIVVIPQAMEIG